MTPNPPSDCRTKFGRAVSGFPWAGLCWLGFAGLAAAAEAPVLLEPVEVTDDRVEEIRPGAASAVTAFDGAFLEAGGIADFEELAPLVPGLFVSAQSPDNVSFNLRGLTTDSTDPRVQARVSVFQDGVALGTAQGNSVALFDLEEVAVFKGPQATRFGVGVQSGALALKSRPAGAEKSAVFTAGVGDFDARNVEAAINSPVIADKLFARVAFYASERDGYVKNLADGSDLQGEDLVALRTSLRWQPTSATTADLIFNHQRDDAPGVDFKSAIFPVSPTTDTDPYTAAYLNRGDELGVERTVTGLTGVVSHEINDAWTVTSTSAWRDADAHHEFDADGSFLYLLELGDGSDGRQLSQELRFAYDEGGRFTAATGVNVAWSEDEQTRIIRTDENVLWKFLTGMDPPIALNPRYVERNTTMAERTSGDVFGRADYKLTERLSVGGGLRLTHERVVSRYQSFAADTPSSFPAALLPTSGGGNTIFKVTDGQLENSDESTAWSGEADVRYEFTPRFTTYAAVSRGRKSPVLDFNDVTLAPMIHAEETVWNYEVGVRGASAGRRVRYDASVFRYDFRHFQTQRATGLGVSQPFDGGRARGEGFETTVQADVARELTLFATYGFTDATFSALGEDGDPQAYAGNTFRLTSRHVVSLGGTASLPAFEGGTVFFTPFYTYRSAYFFEDDNARYGGALRQGGFGLLNLRLGYRANRERWEVVGYVNNVLDKNYLLDAGNTGGNYGIPTNIPAAPRMVGVKATVRF